MSGGNEESTGAAETLEYTPTWIVALVCTVIVAISLLMERLLHYAGKYLKNKGQKPLYEALQKVKEELMLLGFISLLLTVFQTSISKICIPRELARHMLPCSLDEAKPETVAEHFGRRLMSEGTSTYCADKHKVPMLSLEALHHLHIFIFVLAIVHVTFCVLTICFGGAKIRQWKHWEDAIAKENYETQQLLKPKVTHVHQHAFIRDHFMGIGKDIKIIVWLKSFLKQFYASVTKSDYVTLRLGFIMTHCKANPKFNFHKYMIRALEDDFRKVVGISWYLWVFVVIFLLLNVNGWHTYFWIAFIPVLLLLAVGTKLEHVISQLAHEVAEKHIAIEGDLVTYGFTSCIMGQIQYIVPRLIIGVIIQVLCSYSTLPLYAIVTQMGTHFKKEIFEEHVQVGLVGWAQKVKNKRGLKAAAAANNGSGQGGTPDGSSTARIQLSNLARRDMITQAEPHIPGASEIPK